MLTALAAAFSAFVISPRMRQFQNAERLEKNCPTLSHIYRSEPSAIDRLLGVDGGVLDVGFWGTDDITANNLLTVDCLELTQAFADLESLEITNVFIESGVTFPVVTEEIRIFGVSGNSLTTTLDSLLSKQSRLSVFEIERVPEFTDSHLSRLASLKGLRKITLSGVSVTGEGFRAFSDRQYPIELSLAGSLLSTNGLRCIVACDAVQELSLFLECSHVGTLTALQHVNPSMEIYIQMPKECNVTADIAQLLEDLAERLESFNLVAI